MFFWTNAPLRRAFSTSTLMTARNWLVETSLMREVGPYDEKLLVYEDWDLKI